MDVTCEKCSTEYEFDDALVSEQGTSVRCTQCGFKFRVQKRGAASAPELWVIRTVDGRELEYRSLRDLKGAISTGAVTREDVLSRGVGRPRRLASIAELDPFFSSLSTRMTSTSIGLGDEQRPRQRTPHGLGPPTSMPPSPTDGSIAIPLPAQLATSGTQPMRAVTGDHQRTVPGRNIVQTGVAGTPQNVAAAAAALDRLRSDPPPASASLESTVEPSTRRRNEVAFADTHVGDTAIAPSPPESEPTTVRKSLVTPTNGHGTVDVAASEIATREVSRPPAPPPPAPQPAVVSPAAVSPAAVAAPPDSPVPVPAPAGHASDPGRGRQTPTPNEVRFSMVGDEGVDGPRMTAHSTRSPGSSRLVIGLLLAGILAFGLVVVVQRFVLKPAPEQTAAPSDQRLDALLAEADKAFTDGDLDGAKEKLDKASALSETDPRLVRSLARLSNVRAEVGWLKLHVLPQNDPERSSAVREYNEAVDKAQKLVAKAASTQPGDPQVIRAQIDNLRLRNDVVAARKLVDGVSAIAQEPETQLVLGALDLAEQNPPWATVIDRLSKAAQGEGNLGRARALLVYAFAASGDVKAAKAELDRLAGLPRAHPLEGPLRRFLDRVAAGETPSLKVDELPAASGVTPTPDATGDAVAFDTSIQAMRAASDARSKGQLSRAEQIYQKVLDRDPNNSEAIAGLASIARAQGNTGRATILFQRTVDANPNFVPALLSLADLKWDGGDRASATALYNRVLQLVPNGPEAERIRARIQSSAPADTSTPSTASPTTTGAPDAPPASTYTPQTIDPPQDPGEPNK